MSSTVNDATSAGLNGVNLGAVGELGRRIATDPAAGATTWAADVRWDGAFRSTAIVRDFEPRASDEPVGLGGDDTAPNPVEQLLAALGNCLAVGYAANAAVAGIELRDLRIHLQGELDLHAFLGLSEGHAGFSAIRADVALDADADEEALEALHRRVVGSSPVGHTLAAAVPVEIERRTAG